MNPDRMPKTRSVWPTFMVKIPIRQPKVGMIKIAELQMVICLLKVLA